MLAAASSPCLWQAGQGRVTHAPHPTQSGRGRRCCGKRSGLRCDPQESSSTASAPAGLPPTWAEAVGPSTRAPAVSPGRAYCPTTVPPAVSFVTNNRCHGKARNWTTRRNSNARGASFPKVARHRRWTFWRDDEGQRAGPDGDRFAGDVGGGLDRGHFGKPRRPALMIRRRLHRDA